MERKRWTDRWKDGSAKEGKRNEGRKEGNGNGWTEGQKKMEKGGRERWTDGRKEGR